MFRKLKLYHAVALLALLLLFSCNETAPVVNPIAKITATQIAATGDRVLLDGRGSSNPNGKSIKYTFNVAYLSSFISVESDPNSALAYFIPKIPGAYTAQIIVQSADGRKSTTVKQTIMVEKLSFKNIAPIGKNIPLPINITWSCNGGEDTLYFVHMIVGSTPVLISLETGQKTKSLSKSFSNNMTVRYQITASNNGLIEKSELMEFTTAANSPPIANAGTNQTVFQGSLVHLTGAGNDPNGDPVTLTWELDSAPAQIDMTNAHAPNFSFTAPAAGRYVFKLQVSDSVSTAEDSVTIDVNPIQITNCVSLPIGQETKKKLSWQCNVPAQYAVFISTTQEFGARIAYVDANSYMPNNLCHGTTYYWKVEADYMDSVVESAVNTFSIPGASWEQIGLSERSVNCIFANIPGKIYAGTGTGLLKSENEGMEFTEIIPQINVTGISLSDPNTGYISTRGNGILKCTKGIWSNTAGIPLNVSTIGVDPFDPNLVIAPTLYDGIFTSKNGIDFQNIYPGVRSSYNSLIFTESGIFIATNLGIVSCLRENPVWLLDSTIFESHALWCIGAFEDQLMCANDAGNTYLYSAPQWLKSNLVLSSPATAILFINHDLCYIGKNDGGIKRFNGTWQDYNQGLPNLLITALATYENFVYAGNAQGLWRITAR